MEDRLWFLFCIFGAGFVSITNGGRESSGRCLAYYLGWAGQASDVISAYTRIKMEDASTLQELPESASSAKEFVRDTRAGVLKEDTVRKGSG